MRSEPLFFMLSAVVVVVVAAVGCGGSQPAPQRSFIKVERRPAPVWPSPKECPGEAVPSSAFVGERGIQPLESAEQLEGLVGKTVYVTTANRYWGGATPKKTVLPGEPIVLCKAGSFDERDLVRTDEDGKVLDLTEAQKAASDTWVLVKARGEVMMNLPLWTLSVRPPLLNLDEPGTAPELLNGAFLEGLHAMRELRALQSADKKGEDRRSPGFWKRQAKRSYEDAVRSSSSVTALLVKPVGRRGGAADDAARKRGEAQVPAWIEKATDKTLREWAVNGIEDKGLFDAYKTFPECLSLDRDPERAVCMTALRSTEKPATTSNTSHFGGTLLLKRVPQNARVEVDGKSLDVSGDQVKAKYDSDSSHSIVVTPTNTKCRAFSTTRDVKGGATAEVTVLILPSPGCRRNGEP